MLRDRSEDEPAVEVNHELEVHVPQALRTRSVRKDTLGPALVRQNNVSTIALSMARRRVYVGTDFGEVFFWSMRSSDATALFTSHSPHVLVGSHAGCVTALCPLDDVQACAEPLLASGSADRTIKLWDPKRGNAVDPPVLVQTLYEHGGTVTHIMRFNSFLLSTSTDCTVRLWRPCDGRQQLLYPLYEQVRVLVTMPAWTTCLSGAADAFTASKDNFIFAADADARVVRIVASRPTAVEGSESTFDESTLQFAVHSVPKPDEQGGGTEPAAPKAASRGLVMMTYDRQAELLLTSSWDGCLRVYDVVSHALKWQFCNENASCFSGAVYDSVHNQIITLDKRGFLAIYNTQREAMVASKRVTELPTLRLQRADGTDVYMVATTEGASFWRIERNLPYNVVRGGHTGRVISLYTCTGGLGVVPGEEDFRVFSAATDNTARLWDPATMDCLRVFHGPHSETACMTVQEAWSLVFTGHQGGELVIWSIATGSATVLHQHSNTLSCMQVAWISKDMEMLVTGSYDGQVCVWDTRSAHGVAGHTPHMVHKWRAHGGKAGDCDVCVGGTVPPVESRPEINALAFDPQLKLLATGGTDQRIKVWRLTVSNAELSGELLGHSDAVTCFALDGYFLFSGSQDCSICVWDLNAAKSPPGAVSRVDAPVLTLAAHTAAVTGLDVTPDSGHLVSCGLDGQLLVWDYVREAVLWRFRHPHEMLCLALRVDCGEVVVGTAEAAVLRFAVGEGLRGGGAPPDEPLELAAAEDGAVAEPAATAV